MASRIVAALTSLGIALSAGCARESTTPLQASPPAAASSSVSSSGVGCSAEEGRRAARSVQRGLATYYHDSLSGNRTASGARYDPRQLSAAHRELAFGTRVRVTRTDVAAPPVCLTINDRGPFSGRSRILDVSRRAAEHLDMIRAGVVPVQVDVL